MVNEELLFFTSEIAVRLQGLEKEKGFGRVEIRFNGIWGTVCDDDWDVNDANVVCRQLGFPGAESALKGRDVPDGTGPIWLNDVDCTGSEELLTNCRHGGWGRHDCGHNKDAGVQCIVSGKSACEFLSSTVITEHRHIRSHWGNVPVIY